MHAIRVVLRNRGAPNRWVRRLIPSSLSTDLWYPRYEVSVFILPFGHEAVPGGAGRRYDGVVIVEQSVGEEPLFQVKPDALDRVQFRRIGRQRHQPTLSGTARATEPCQPAWSRTITASSSSASVSETGRGSFAWPPFDIGHDQRERVVCPGFNGGEDIGESEALVAKPGRALPPLPPDVADAAFLADPRFVLEKQAGCAYFYAYAELFSATAGLFLKASAFAAGSFKGWLGPAFVARSRAAAPRGSSRRDGTVCRTVPA